MDIYYVNGILLYNYVILFYLIDEMGEGKGREV